MAQKVKVQCRGPVWSEKLGVGWISNRSGWLLELLTELIKYSNIFHQHMISAKGYNSSYESYWNAKKSLDECPKCLHLMLWPNQLRDFCNKHKQLNIYLHTKQWKSNFHTRQVAFFWRQVRQGTRLFYTNILHSYLQLLGLADIQHSAQINSFLGLMKCLALFPCSGELRLIRNNANP